MGKRKDQERQEYMDMINDKIAELDAATAEVTAEQEKQAQLDSVGNQYGSSGFFRGGNTKELNAFSKGLGLDISEPPTIPDSLRGGFDDSTASTFGDLSGAITDPNAIYNDDTFTSNQAAEELYNNKLTT